MVRVRSATALQCASAALSCSLGMVVAACGGVGAGDGSESKEVSEKAEASLAAFRKKVGFDALHTGPRKLPMVFRLGEDVPEAWIPVIQEVFDTWEGGVGKDLFAFAAGTLSGRSTVRVKSALEKLPVPFEDGYWSIVASKKAYCRKKVGDNPAACARYTPTRDDSGTVTDWHPVEQDVLFDVGSYDFRTDQPVEAPPADGSDPAADAPPSDVVVGSKIALSLRQVLTHELGHVLGMPHSTASDGSSIMGPASLAREGVYVVEGPTAPQTFDYDRLKKLVDAWDAQTAK